MEVQARPACQIFVSGSLGREIFETACICVRCIKKSFKINAYLKFAINQHNISYQDQGLDFQA